MDKTWVWQDGAGYFAESGHFTAWSGTGEKTTYAGGLWWVDDKGPALYRCEVANDERR